ncbi:hypothetical protein ABW20_dc0105296 [Dactylellina cionopaga]|nr:hypothetical protein ABW20_dc0105296 [Dactylellina cionopaga]
MDRRDEFTPLLQQQQQQTTNPSNIPVRTDRDTIIDSEAGSPRISRTRRALPILVLFIIIVFIFDCSDTFLTSPLVRIYEDIICRQYYGSHQPQSYPGGGQIPEEKCKIAPVQKELAIVRGLEPVFDAIPSLIVAIPLGMLADNPKIGRKPIITAALFGSLLQSIWVVIVTRSPDIIPLRFVWLGSVFQLTGGSNGMNTMLFTMIIDLTAPADRASTFFTMQLAGTWLPVLIGPPIVSHLMENVGNWIPVFIGLILAILGCFLLLSLPETINFLETEATLAQNTENTSLIRDIDCSSSTSTDSTDSLTARQKFRSQCHSQFKEFVESSSFVFQSPHLITLICSLMLHMLCLTRCKEMILWYASARYSISIAKATLLDSINAAVSIGILFLLPFISKYLTSKLGVSSQRKDLLIAQVSVVLFAVGWYIVGLAPTLPLAIIGLVVYVLGSGFSGSVRSLASSYVEPHHQARLSSFIAIMMTVGSLVGSPLLAWLYSLGVSSGNPFWFGLPFVALAVVFTMIGFALWFTMELPEEGAPVIIDEGDCEQVR